MECHWLKDQRGSVLLFTIALMVFLLVMGGIAIDLTYLGAARGELQRSMDAAALAGAGNLGFDDTVFPTVRQEAWRFGNLNPYRVGTVNLDQNAANDPSGDIVLGIWDGAGFTPSDDGTRVNAVQCQYATQIPTSFLQLLGFATLPVSARAIAVSNPPAAVGCDEPVLPIGVTPCSFYDAGTGAFNNSNGCGTGMTFIRSQTLCQNAPGSPQGCNTATWVSLDGSTPSTPYLRNAIRNAGNPTGTCAATLGTNDSTEANNGMIDPVFAEMADALIANRAVPLPSGDVCLGECDETNLTYPASGGGWEIGVMVIDPNQCPPGPLANSHDIMTYAKFVITQVFYKQEGCVTVSRLGVPNPDPQADQFCYEADGVTPRKDPDLRAIFGYFVCDKLGTISTLDPVPRAALAPRLRLVQ